MRQPAIELITGVPQYLVKNAGRLCYDSFYNTKTGLPKTEEDDNKLLLNLVEKSHLTCLEHAHFNILTPMLDRDILMYLHGWPKSPNYFDNVHNDCGILHINLSQVRQLANQENPIRNHLLSHYTDLRYKADAFGDALLRAVEPYAPILVSDLSIRPVVRSQYNMQVLADKDLDYWERLWLPSVSIQVTCSRACGNQWTRHRMAHEQRSQRYVDEGEFDVIMPPDSLEDIHNGIFDADFWRDTIVDTYKMLRRKPVRWPKGTARYVLPNAAVTHIMTTADLRGWHHFLQVRLASDAQEEIRYCAYLVWQQLMQLWPDTFYNITPCLDGLEPWLDNAVNTQTVNTSA
jgi:flavin-dependent thymidylate synthase